jgi:XTP/dITP diphosphohydrolase
MKLVLATSNPGKLAEIRSLLKGLDHEVVSQSDYGVVDAVENGQSFTENALIKARHANVHTSLPAIADDSGLEVDYLEGKPGIYSARYAGEGATDAENIEKLLNELNGVPFENRTARFHCVITLVKGIDDPDPLICHGLWEGVIAESPSGDNGFGYDPVFFIPELGCTSAKLPPAIKNKHSHRGQALQKLLQLLL